MYNIERPLVKCGMAAGRNIAAMHMAKRFINEQKSSVENSISRGDIQELQAAFAAFCQGIMERLQVTNPEDIQLDETAESH